jgi:hypothetical protein
LEELKSFLTRTTAFLAPLVISSNDFLVLFSFYIWAFSGILLVYLGSAIFEMHYITLKNKIK